MIVVVPVAMVVPVRMIVVMPVPRMSAVFGVTAVLVLVTATAFHRRHLDM